MFAKGLPWDLRRLQGKYRTWYTGSFASFESAADVMDYNFQLMENDLCIPAPDPNKTPQPTAAPPSPPAPAAVPAGTPQPHCYGPENTTLNQCKAGQTSAFTRDSKIAIIGAGASGLSLGYSLKKRGFKNIRFFEKQNRIGGYPQTVKYPGSSVPHEYATTYTVGRYECILRAMDELDIDVVEKKTDEVRYGNPPVFKGPLTSFWF